MPQLPEGFVLDAPQSDDIRLPKTGGDTFLGDVALGAKKRAAGIGELGLKLAEGFGVEGLEPYREDLAAIQREYQRQGEGTGVSGVVAEALGDPLSYLPIAGGSQNLLKGVAATGALSGVTRGTGEIEGDLTENIKQAGLEGIMSLATGALAQKIMKPVSEGVSKNAKELQELGVDLTPAQKTGNRALEMVEAGFENLPFTAGKQRKIIERQLGQFTEQALKKAGIKGTRATPEVLQSGSERFGKIFSNLTKKTGVRVDDELLESMSEIAHESTKRYGKDGSRVIMSYIDDILEGGGKIDGKTYQNTRSALSNIAYKDTDPLKAMLARDLKIALDDAAERAIPKSMAKTWNKVREKYASFKTIEKAMSSTAQPALDGLITPTQLLMGVKRGNKMFARDTSELASLARAGKDVLASKIPDSGTAGRSFMQDVLTGTLGVGGFATGGAGGAATALAAPRIAQETYMSTPVQKYITEGVTDSIIPAIAASRGVTSAVGDEMTGGNQSAASEGSPSPLPEGFLIDSAPDTIPTIPQNIPDQSIIEPQDFTQRNEGYSPTVYKDTKGLRTIGYGFNMQSGIANKVWKQAGIETPFKDVYTGKAAITQEQAQRLYRESMKIATDDARKVYKNFDFLSRGAQDALRDLSYHHGLPRLKKSLGAFNTAINKGYINTAIQKLKDSDYARSFPERSKLVINKLLSEA